MRHFPGIEDAGFAKAAFVGDERSFQRFRSAAREILSRTPVKGRDGPRQPRQQRRIKTALLRHDVEEIVLVESAHFNHRVDGFPVPIEGQRPVRCRA